MKNNEEEIEGVKTYVSIYTIHHEKIGNYLQSLDTLSRVILLAIAEFVYLTSNPHYIWKIYRKMKSHQNP